MAQALREVTATLRAQSEHQSRLKGDMGSTERTARQLAKQLRRAKQSEDAALATSNALQARGATERVRERTPPTAAESASHLRKLAAANLRYLSG